MLQRGITGIRGRKDPPTEPPFSDLVAFRSHCHIVAREVGAKLLTVQDRREAVGACNYAIARFEFSDSEFVVLLNAIHPILAIAKWPAENEIVFEYINCPKLTEAFTKLGVYLFATCDELNQPLVREMYKDLTPTKHECIRYFRPRRIGDVIFNYWD
jgi:hypothetical protein